MTSKALSSVIIFLCIGTGLACGYPYGAIGHESSAISTEWSSEKQAYLGKLLTLVSQRRVKEALGNINARIRANPKDACYYAIRARVYASIDENDAALADADKALAVSPRLLVALLAKSNALLRIERPKEALVFNDKAFALQPKANAVLDDRIDILAALGRREEAISLLEEQLVDDSKDHVKRGQLIKLYAAQKVSAKVIEHVTIQLKEGVRNKDLFLTLRGNAYTKLKMFKRAEQDYTQALKANSNYFEAYRGLINVYKMTGRKKEADDFGRRLQELEGDIQPL